MKTNKKIRKIYDSILSSIKLLDFITNLTRIENKLLQFANIRAYSNSSLINVVCLMVITKSRILSMTETIKKFYSLNNKKPK